jgi:DNA ligase-1
MITQEKRKREAKAADKGAQKAGAGPVEERNQTREENKGSDKGPTKIKLEVMLAHVFDPEKHDPTGWWMSEKLDGVRAYWTGSNFYSR